MYFSIRKVRALPGAACSPLSGSPVRLMERTARVSAETEAGWHDLSVEPGQGSLEVTFQWDADLRLWTEQAVLEARLRGSVIPEFLMEWTRRREALCFEVTEVCGERLLLGDGLLPAPAVELSARVGAPDQRDLGVFLRVTLRREGSRGVRRLY